MSLVPGFYLRYDGSMTQVTKVDLEQGRIYSLEESKWGWGREKVEYHVFPGAGSVQDLFWKHHEKKEEV